jgi:nucleotide-binding universal stress UspA family protein
LLAAAAARAALVVVGPPAQRHLSGFRGTAHHVLAHSQVPVVVVSPIVAGPHAPLLGHVVVGVDGDDDPDPALEFGFQRAAGRRCVLAAVHVTSRQHDDYWFDYKTLSTHLSAEPVALDLLARAVEPWIRRYPQVPVKCAVYSGRALPGLRRAAHGARLLVLGDHGRAQLGPAGRALLGSVAHGAVDGATGPVAVVRGAQREPVHAAADVAAPKREGARS